MTRPMLSASRRPLWIVICAASACVCGCSDGGESDDGAPDAGPAQSNEGVPLPEYDGCASQQLQCTDWLAPETCSCDENLPVEPSECIEAGIFLCDREVLAVSSSVGTSIDAGALDTLFDVNCRCAEAVSSAEECATLSEFRCAVYSPEPADCYCAPQAPGG